MFKIAAILSGMLFIGCNVAKRNIERMQTYAVRYPDQFKILSNQLDPCFIGSAKSDTIISTSTDTLIKEGATTIVRIKDTLYITKTLPGKVITNTKTLSIHDTIADGRALQAQQVQFKIKSDSLIVVKTNAVRTAKNLSIWRLIALCACAVILIFIVIRIYVFFSGGGAANIIKKIT